MIYARDRQIKSLKNENLWETFQIFKYFMTDNFTYYFILCGNYRFYDTSEEKKLVFNEKVCFYYQYAENCFEIKMVISIHRLELTKRKSFELILNF